MQFNHSCHKENYAFVNSCCLYILPLTTEGQRNQIFINLLQRNHWTLIKLMSSDVIVTNSGAGLILNEIVI